MAKGRLVTKTELEMMLDLLERKIGNEFNKEILKLPDGAWIVEDEIKNEDPPFQSWFKLLMRKRKFLEDLLEKEEF